MIARLFSEENIYALGWTVLHSLWQAFLIALLMGLAMLFLQKRSARLRYWLANAALFSVLLLSVATFFSLRQEGIASAMPEITLLLDAQTTTLESPEPHTLKLFKDRFLAYFNTHLPVVVTIWLVGLAFLVLRMLGGLAYVQHLRHSGRLMTGYWQQRLSFLAEQLAVSRPVRLLESALVKAPLVVGVLKPVILLPMGAVNGLNVAEVEAILAHELAHIRRHDFLLNLLQSVVEVLYYFNPAVWWISANIRLERENCCDDLAVAFCGNSIIYAKALVRVQEWGQQSPSFAMAFSGRKNQMLMRVKRILNQSQNRSNIMEKLSVTLLLILAIGIFSISADRPVDLPEEDLHFSTLADAHTLDWHGVDAKSVVLPESKLELITVETLEGETFEILVEEVDTLPQGKTTLNMTKDGEKIEAKIVDGEIIFLKIDGKEIPESDYDKYEAKLEDVLSEGIPAPPIPPVPPVPPVPGAVPAPPAPPAPGAIPAPPAPPVPKVWQFDQERKKKVTTKKNEDGKTVIIIESDDGSPMELIIDKDEDVVILDGKILEDGETAIIIDEDAPSVWSGVHFGEAHERAFARIAPHINTWSFSDGDSSRFYFNFEGLEDELLELDEEKLKLLKEEQQHLRELLEDERKAIRELRAIERKEALERREESRSHRERIEREERAIARELRDELRHREREIRAERSAERRHQNEIFQSKLEQEMIADGLIEDATNYKLELSGNALRVNGKKQDKNLHKKYLDIYREFKGKSLEGKSKVVIEKSSD